MSFEKSLKIKSTETFLKTLTGVLNPEIMFMVLKDRPEAKVSPKHMPGTLSFLKTELSALNQRGAGIFIMINEGDNLGRRKENVTGIRAFFMDFDEDPGQIKFALDPSIVVRTKRGKHYYWLIENKIPLEDFPIIQKQLAQKYNSDPKVNDLPRVMRLPGFFHNKSEPFLVELESCNGHRYQSESFYRAFDVSPDAKELSKEIKGPTKRTEKKFEKWIEDQISEDPERNNALTKIMREGLALGFSKDFLEGTVSKFCIDTGLPVAEGMTVLSYQQKYHKQNNFEARYTDKIQSHKEAAVLFSNEIFKNEEGLLTLRCWRNDFYEWTGKRYSLISKKDLSTKILIWSHERTNFSFNFGTHAASEIIFHLSALCLLDNKIEMNTFIDGSQIEKCIAFENGILNLDQRKNRNDLNLGHHTPNFFNHYCLPFNFEYGSSSAIWEELLERILPYEDQRELLQQWFGYHLCNGLNFQKFMVLYGDGANGKSVIIKVLKEMIGSENISAVPIEQMSLNKTYAVASMEGKVANIVEEISSTDKVSEGLLKDLISGGNITVERKYQDPHIMTPTAKLTFATNNLPYIKDASHGFWRRMLILPFNVQIPEEEQNRDFSDSNFWRKSGELSGIFEWSVAGYQSLKKYGFSIPKSSKDLTEEYRLDTNPFRQWLLDNYEASPKGKVSMKEIKFRFQMDSHSERRYMPSNHTIKREIFREFRSVKWSKNPLTFDSGERSRCFLGLKAKIDCTLDTHIW